MNGASPSAARSSGVKHSVAVEGRVAWIHVAPIKALAIDERREAYIGACGVEDDRRFCIVDEKDKMINAKRVAKLVAIRPELDGDRLTLHVPGSARVAGAVSLGEPLTITIFSRSA